MGDKSNGPVSNPLPPPPRPPRSSSNNNGSSARAENLSNADFRRMVMETPRRSEETPHHKDRSRNRGKRADDDDDAETDRRGHNHSSRKHRPKPKEEEKKEEPELPKYRDRAKERREDQNPDYDHTATEFGSLHAVAPPGTVDLRTTMDAHRISIENSKFLGGDVEHTHLVKGLDYALLHKVRSEIDREPDDDNDEDDAKRRSQQEENSMVFRTASAKLIYQWVVKPQNLNKTNEMFLPGRTAFVYDLDEEFSHDIPTTLHRSKADCPAPQEMVTVSVDSSVLDRIAKIMTYLRLGSSGKILKKKKKDKNDSSRENRVKGVSTLPTEEETVHEADTVNRIPKKVDYGNLPPLPPVRKVLGPRTEDDDIFQGSGVDYVPTIDDDSPVLEDMEESPREAQRPSYFSEPGYGPAPPPNTSQEWPQQAGYDGVQGPLLPSAYQGEWQEYPAAPPETYAGPWLPDQLPYSEQYLHNQIPDFTQAPPAQAKDPRFMTQEEKDRGLGSVFKRDDQSLQQRREMDARERDPNFISASYSECYPGYQEYNREIVDSDEDEDLTKMDMGGRAKGRLHRWDFETEEDWAKYNEQKEAMPKAAFQFGVKMQDGRKTRKQNKDQKLNNELHKINQIIDRKKKDKMGGYDDASHFDEEIHPVKKLRV
ncbi:hypothetical protein GOP47_0019634 [Adiantum capillus-veneris]|uniref:Uncharacterized protein n=1 Tax=Adiantum capillus-veneris TaxID=13818 RepID=A0A9D4UBE7_ADICA|nr:hypothetical protein GOP47_0019634 [Adiantum capillus-veneris]